MSKVKKGFDWFGFCLKYLFIFIMFGITIISILVSIDIVVDFVNIGIGNMIVYLSVIFFVYLIIMSGLICAYVDIRKLWAKEDE